MAAGTNNYFNIDYYWRGSNNVAMIVNPAKTQQFGTSISDLNQLLAFIKATFYLDDVVGFKANYNGVDYHGFWGVVITGGVNEKMHRRNRWLEIHADTTTANKHFLNDAGLNTKGISVTQSTDSPQIDSFKVKATFKSAFFVPTNQFGVRYRMLTGTGYTSWFEVIVDSVRAQNTIFEEIIYLPNVSQDYVGVGDFVMYTTFIINNEGRYDSSDVTAQKVELVPVQLKSPDASSPVLTYYTNTQAWVLADADKDGVMDLPLAKVSKIYIKNSAGGYRDATPGRYFFPDASDSWFVVGGLAGVGQTNLVLYGETIGGGGGNPYETRTFLSRNVNSATACRDARIRPGDIKAYRRFNEAVFYTTIDFNTVVPNSYAVSSVEPGVYDISQFVNGELNYGIGYCPV